MIEFLTKAVFILFLCSLGLADELPLDAYTYSGAKSEKSLDGFVPNYRESNTEYKRLINRSNQDERGNSFESEQPIFIIKKKNLRKYSHYLSPGLHTLLEKYPNFEVPVFYTYRSSDHPEKVKQTLLNKESSKIDKDNLRKYIPFRFPKSGSEVMLNHLSRYQGDSEEKKTHSFVTNSKGSFSRVGLWSKRVSPAVLDKGTKEIQFYVLAKYFEPTSLVGDILLVHEPVPLLRKNRKAWIYSSAQRRVRRAPDASHDATGRGSQGLITADQIDGFNGDLERFDWLLRGREVLIVPYNLDRLNNKKISYETILGKNCVNAEFLRFEFHRVWIVEARLKESSRHIYPKRIFYVDEDSWMVLMEDTYSTRGDLWRVGLHGLIQQKEENFPWYRVHIHHDLNNNLCFVSGLDNEVNSPLKFGFKDKMRSFTPDALRRLHVR